MCSRKKCTIIECGSRKEFLEQMLYLIAFNGSGLYQPNGLSIPTHGGLSELVHLDNNLVFFLSSLCMQLVVILRLLHSPDKRHPLCVCFLVSWRDFCRVIEIGREEQEIRNGFLINRNCFENHLGELLQVRFRISRR